MEFITFFERFTFPTYIIAVTVIVELIKALAKPRFNPKWITLAVAIVGAVIQIVFDPNATVDSWWKLLISLGIAVLGYDYFLKPVKDLIGTGSVK